MTDVRKPMTVLLALALTTPVRAAEQVPKDLEEIGVTEHLGERIDLDLRFTDEEGRQVRLGDLFAGEAPVLLTLNYYRCTMLCDIQLKNLVETLRELDWTGGKDFRLVTVSFDPREATELAKGKRATLLKTYAREGAEWRFLVSPDDQVRSLAEQLGFRYRYIEDKNQYAHPAVLYAVAPDGMIARYIYGLSFQSRDLKFSLMEASQGRTASTVDKLILSCFHYDAEAGRYAPWAFGIMRLGGGVTLALVALLMIVLWRVERTRKRAATQ